MTRGGVDDLRDQLFAEAQRHGLAQAAKVLVVADGAACIWHLAQDRFAQAEQRLDYYHASRHLWAVAHALYPDDEAAAKTWMRPLLQKLKQGRVLGILKDLQGLAKRLRQKKRQALVAELAYLESHRERMDYGWHEGWANRWAVAPSLCARSQCYRALGWAAARCAKKGVTLWFSPLETKEGGAW